MVWGVGYECKSTVPTYQAIYARETIRIQCLLRVYASHCRHEKEEREEIENSTDIGIMPGG